jgi:hypothetical protein
MFGAKTSEEPFKGSRVCYSRAYKLLRWMGDTGGYVKQVKDRKGRTVRCEVDEEMRDLVTALDRGDEETIKSYLINPRFLDIIHG